MSIVGAIMEIRKSYFTNMIFACPSRIPKGSKLNNAIPPLNDAPLTDRGLNG
jgi:hypothetical protein